MRLLIFVIGKSPKFALLGRAAWHSRNGEVKIFELTDDNLEFDCSLGTKSPKCGPKRSAMATCGTWTCKHNSITRPVVEVGQTPSKYQPTPVGRATGPICKARLRSMAKSRGETITGRDRSTVAETTTSKSTMRVPGTQSSSLTRLNWFKVQPLTTKMNGQIATASTVGLASEAISRRQMRLSFTRKREAVAVPKISRSSSRTSSASRTA